MDTQTMMKALLSSDALTGVGKAAGVSSADAGKVLAQVLPQLLSGAQAQANGPATAQGFLNALASHGKADTRDLSSFLGGVDTDDGAKIVSHLLGDQEGEITRAAAKKTGLNAKQVSKILSAAAPLLMSLLGQQTSGASAGNIGSLLGGLLSNKDTASMLLGLLGGTSTTSSGKKKPSAKKDDLAGTLGNLLGGLLK